MCVGVYIYIYIWKAVYSTAEEINRERDKYDIVFSFKKISVKWRRHAERAHILTLTQSKQRLCFNNVKNQNLVWYKSKRIQ